MSCGYKSLHMDRGGGGGGGGGGEGDIFCVGPVCIGNGFGLSSFHRIINLLTDFQGVGSNFFKVCLCVCVWGEGGGGSIAISYGNL